MLRWSALVVSFAACIAAFWRANYLFGRMVEEVNATVDPHERISIFWHRRHLWRAMLRHKLLFPNSELRRQYYWWIVVMIGLWFVMVFFLSLV